MAELIGLFSLKVQNQNTTLTFESFLLLENYILQLTDCIGCKDLSKYQMTLLRFFSHYIKEDDTVNICGNVLIYVYLLTPLHE